jgi:hypothetical protein
VGMTCARAASKYLGPSTLIDGIVNSNNRRHILLPTTGT